VTTGVVRDSSQRGLCRQLGIRIAKGRWLVLRGQVAPACDEWLRAWEVVKQLTAPDIRDTEEFDRRYRILSQRVSDWCQDFEMELGNAGLDNPLYYEQRVRYAREFIALFPDENALVYLNMRRAEGEALWALGHRAEAEAVYRALVERLPDEAWAYIGWADRYWLMQSSSHEYEAAEAIMRRALERPKLQERPDVLERLADLYGEWGKPAERASMLEQIEALQARPELRRAIDLPPVFDILPPEPTVEPVARKLGRNDPCWCGSGKKYKRCHLDSDQQRR